MIKVRKGRDAMANPKLEEAIATLQSSNFRITPQRYAILEYLVEKHNHPTVDDIYRALESRFPNMSVATVYNNLKIFIEAGLVKEMVYGDASSRFDYTSTQHYHAICENCGKVVDVFYPGLEDVEVAAEKLTGFQIHEHRMELYGLCPECTAKRALGEKSSK